jgi:hypothetical protein
MAFSTGDEVDLRVGDPDKDDPVNAAAWGANRRVRAAVVAALALGAGTAPAGRVAALRLAGAWITGDVDLRDGDLGCPIVLRHCRFDGMLNLDGATTRSVVLSGSHLTELAVSGVTVRGSLVLRDVVINAGAGQRALRGERMDVAGDLRAPRLRSTGSTCLIGSQVRGLVTFADADLRNPGLDALNAGGLHVGGSMFLDGLRTDGEVRLPGARIGGVLLLDAARLHHPTGRALFGEALSVGSDVIAGRGFRADGTFYLASSKIGSRLILDGARLNTPEGNALNLASATIDRSVYMEQGFRAVGQLRLTGAVIAAHLSLHGVDSPDAVLSLFAVRVGVIRHGREPGWLDGWPNRVNMDGCVYTAFDPYLPAKARLELMERQIGGYRAQPYEQLAGYYRGLGHDEHARTVLLAKLRAHRRALPWYLRLPGLVLDILVGYGYRPLRAIGWALLLLAAGSVFFAHHRPTHVQSDDTSQFNPVLYTADLLVPIVRFGQQDPWQSHGVAAAVASTLTILGWALSVAIAAAAARTLNRN